MRRWICLLAWLAVLGLGSLVAAEKVHMSTDLTAFLPTGTDADATVLLDAARNGTAARLMLLAIGGGDAQQRAKASRQLTQALRQDPRFVRVENGVASDPDALIQPLLQHRYLLSPAVTAESFSVASLHQALLQRLADLASPTSAFTAQWVTQDPTGALMPLLARWRPQNAPRIRAGVWATQDGKQAILLVETRASGFDLAAQTPLVNEVRTQFSKLAMPGLTLQMAGAGPFSVLLRDRTRHEVKLYSALASVAMFIVLLLAYRSLWLVLLGGLPMLSAVLAGLLVSQAVFGEVYGITLAFGITLIGVVADYPLHLFSHLHPNEPVHTSLKRIWPTLHLSAVNMLVAYCMLTFTGFSGLSQLGVFAATGLATAWLSTRWLMPYLLTQPRFDAADGWAGVAVQWLKKLPVWRWPAAVLLLASVAVLVGLNKPMWNDDLAGLTPVPKPLQALGQRLRSALGAPDLGYVISVPGNSSQQVLARSEQLLPLLKALQARQAIGGFDAAARFLPSVATQQQHQQALPDAATLKANLHAALQATPYMEAAFAPFLQDVAAARTATPLTLADVQGSLIGLRIAPMLVQQGDAWHALLPLSAVQDVAAVQAAVAASGVAGATLVNLKATSARMVASFRSDALWQLGIVVLTTLVIMFWGLPWRRYLPTLLPMAAAVLGVTAGYYLLDIRLNLFHLISLMLVAGLAEDYALFLGADAASDAERARSLHAVTLCLASSVSVFGILGMSEIPVLQAIGQTVTAGVLLGCVLGVLGARPRLAAALARRGSQGR